MINLYSINCGLAFAPYLLESLTAFLDEEAEVSRVVRHSGSGLIIRSAGEIVLRYRNREASFGTRDLAHYLAAIGFRAEAYDILRMSDEVVMANIGDNILLSHPQSELWLDLESVSRLLAAFRDAPVTAGQVEGLPEWLNASLGAERLLLSDQRNGRWVLLGSDHIAELERRAPLLDSPDKESRRKRPPTLTLKGVTIHLQTAGRLASALDTFSETGEVTPFEEIAPEFRLVAARATEGLEIKDSDKRAAFTAREARKWAAIIRSELSKLNVSEIVRGKMKTVFADGENGRWVLQWGDEVFVPDQMISSISAAGKNEPVETDGWPDDWPRLRRTDEFLLLLDKTTGACVALTDDEADYLTNAV